MKKWIAGMLAAIMLVCCMGTAMAYKDDGSFDSTLVNAFGYSNTQWMSTSLDRAMLTVLTLLNYGGEYTNYRPFTLSEPSYVAKKDKVLTVCVAAESGRGYLVFLCSPDAKAETDFMFLESCNSTAMKTILDETNTVVYRNDIDDLLTVTQLFKEAMAD